MLSSDLQHIERTEGASDVDEVLDIGAPGLNKPSKEIHLLSSKQSGTKILNSIECLGVLNEVLDKIHP